MRFDRDFLTSGTGQVLLVVTVLVLGVLTMRWQKTRRTLPPLATAAKAQPAVPLPKVLTREGQKFVAPVPTAVSRPLPGPEATRETSKMAAPTTRSFGLLLTDNPAEAKRETKLTAPYGRLIPCETVVALESNRLETPVIGLVTEDVWHDGRRVIPAGAEVHARAALDRTRERLSVTGPWHIVWRTSDADNGTELTLDGIALEREFEAGSGAWGPLDGSAGLRGTIVRSRDDRELRLFASSFLTAALSALQDTRVTAGVLGEASVPVVSAKNAALAGSAAVLRDYTNQMREAVARDGFFLRVPAGKAFYLYVTQTIDRSAGKATNANSPSL